MNLSSLNEGQVSSIYKVEDINSKMNRRLIELGFVKNEKVEVIKNLRKAKTMLICIRGYVLSLDYTVTNKVFIWNRGGKQ